MLWLRRADPSTTLDKVSRKYLEATYRNVVELSSIPGDIPLSPPLSPCATLLVEVRPHTSSWFPAGLIDDLEKLLSRKVDVLTDGGISPYLKDQIYREALPL